MHGSEAGDKEVLELCKQFKKFKGKRNIAFMVGMNGRAGSSEEVGMRCKANTQK